MASRSAFASVLLTVTVALGAVRYAAAPPLLPQTGETGTAAQKTTKSKAGEAAARSRNPARPGKKVPCLTADCQAREPQDVGETDAMQVLKDQLRLAIGEEAAARALPIVAGTIAKPQSAGGTQPLPDAVIAIFPDPIHTHLALRFDRSVDSLIDAAQDAGWYLDRQWLPWSWMQAGEPGAEKDTPEIITTRRYRHGFESVPGFISFRPIDPGDPKRKPLLVFVVGDSPISGIIPEQFHTAYQGVAQLAGPGELRIIGPSFTGSVDSLNTLLGSEAKAGPSFRFIHIASPTISRDLENFLFDRTPEEKKEAIDFVSFGMAQSCKIQSVVRFLNAQTDAGAEPLAPGEREADHATQIAMLSEDESAFGHAMIARSVGPSECDLRGIPLLHLTFPRDISHLRSAYQKKSIWGFGTGSNGGTSLDLDFTDPHEELDAVPNFASAQTAASQETTIRHIAETLTERDVRVVLLSATDVFDELFLARVLSRLAPNLSVVVLDSDALFLRKGGSDTYNHTFVATPFPSLPLDHFWTAPENLINASRCTPRNFPSESSQGAYLAAGRILAGPGFIREQSCSALYSSPLEATKRPPLWIASVEHGGLWPVAVLNLEADAPSNIPAYEFAPGQEPLTGMVRHHVPVSLWLGLFGLLVLVACHAYGCLLVSLDSSLLWDYSATGPPTRRRKLLLQLGLTLVALVAIGLVVPPGMGRLVEHSILFRCVHQVVLLLLAGLAGRQVWLLLLTAKAASAPAKPGWSARRPLALALLAAVSAYGVGWLPWHLLSSSGGAHVEYFERYRSLWLFSGNAPTLPPLLLLAALAAGLLSRLGRLYFSGPWRPRLPIRVPEGVGVPNEGGAFSICSLIAEGGSRENLVLWGITASVFTLGHFALEWAAPNTLDGPVYTGGLKYLAALVMALICFDLLKSWALWHLLRHRLLRPLERTPLRRGFDRIKGMPWQKLWRTMDSSPQFTYHPVRRALQLATSLPSRLGPANDVTQPAITHWKGVLASPSDPECTASWQKMLAALATIAQNILPDMVTAWSKETGTVTAADDAGDERGKELARQTDPLPAQEEFVALIYIQYVRLVLIQVRHGLFTAALSYVLLAAALTQYPIVGRHAIEIGLSLLFAFLATVGVSVYAAINRDSILSRTTEHEPGKLDFDFYVKIVSYLGLPLIGLLVSQFPELSSSVLSLLQPGSGGAK